MLIDWQSRSPLLNSLPCKPPTTWWGSLLVDMSHFFFAVPLPMLLIACCNAFSSCVPKLWLFQLSGGSMIKDLDCHAIGMIGYAKHCLFVTH